MAKMKTSSRLISFLCKNLIFLTVGFLVVFALKYYYCVATSDQLRWILSPTASLVEYLAGIHFEEEAQIGFMSREYGLVLVPACAGVNFLIMAFCALYFSNIHRLDENKRKMLWIGASLSMSYLLTVMVNALRIVASVFLNNADIYGIWVTPARVHRIEGTLIYFFFLVLIHQAGKRFTAPSSLKWIGLNISCMRRALATDKNSITPLVCAFGVPFLCFMLIGVGIPVLNGAWRQNGPRFAEHCITVAAVCLIALLFILLLVVGYRGIGFVIQKMKGKIRAGAW